MIPLKLHDNIKQFNHEKFENTTQVLYSLVSFVFFQFWIKFWEYFVIRLDAISCTKRFFTDQFTKKSFKWSKTCMNGIFILFVPIHWKAIWNQTISAKTNYSGISEKSQYEIIYIELHKLRSSQPNVHREFLKKIDEPVEIKITYSNFSVGNALNKKSKKSFCWHRVYIQMLSITDRLISLLFYLK